METNTKVVMWDSDEAAKWTEGISGWVSRDGFFWGKDERAARYSGCTHVLCEDCGSPIDKGHLICRECTRKREIKKYEAMPKAEWNEAGMIYSIALNKYFSCWEDAEYCAEDHESSLNDMLLVICEPQYLHFIDEDNWCDELAEDGELPDTVAQALDELNEAIKEYGPVSWFPGNKAAMINTHEQPATQR